MNFINSPGANLLRALGVSGPWSQQPQDATQPGPMNSMNGGILVTNPAQQMQVNAGLPAPETGTGPAIPKPPHGGLFNRLAQAFMGGGA